jgi:hypothetical protein
MENHKFKLKTNRLIIILKEPNQDVNIVPVKKHNQIMKENSLKIKDKNKIKITQI